MTTTRPQFLTTRQCLALAAGYLVTVNMQHIYEARRSPETAQALFGDPGAHHCLDGRGALTLFRRAKGGGALPLVQGNVLLSRWLERNRDARLLVIGSSAATVRQVLTCYPKMTVAIDDRIMSIGSPADASRTARDLATRHAGDWNLIVLALGVPKQELIAQALQHQLAAPIYCLGGSFEILANALPRSPAWVQKIGLEGLWRLGLEPSLKRIERLVRSYVVFAQLRLRRAAIDQLVGRRR